jgi:hypothetical protein
MAGAILPGAANCSRKHVLPVCGKDPAQVSMNLSSPSHD